MIDESLRQFVNILPEPSVLITGDGIIMIANAAMAEFCGVAASRLVGESFATLVADGSARVPEYIRVCSRSRELLPGGFAWKHSSGSSIDARCDAAVIIPHTQTQPAILFVRCRPKAESTDQFVLLNQKIEALSQEILDRKKIERQRDELFQSEKIAREQVERNSRMKDEFLATLSHELRTPLSAIIGWTQLLKKTQDPQSINDGMGVIERNAQIQKQLIEDLLDMSGIISGKVRLTVQMIDLPAVIDAAIQSVQPSAEARQIRLQPTLDRTIKPIKGDANRLQQIVWNLLSNAIKFTPKGGRVQIFLERINSHVEITISDTGEGIKPEFLPHVFDRFRQGDESTTRRHGGLGLGLSIVKQLAELHGGSVRAKSPGPGLGSTFILALPVVVLHNGSGHNPPPAAGHSKPESERGNAPIQGDIDLAGLSLLVLDDEPDARDLIRRLLEDCKAKVVVAGSATEGLEALSRFRPDLIISDIGMPEIDGYAFISMVRSRSREHGGRVPALALTAFARGDDRTRALRAGFNLHLSKPIDVVEFITTVASLTGRIGGSGSQ